MFVANGRELWVGSAEQYKTIASAVAASRDGDTIYVRAGTYVNDWATIDHDVRIVGVGGMAHLQSTTAIANAKAALIVNADTVIENLEFSGARVADLNGAGIRYQAGDLTIKNSYFHDNENGILGAANATGHIVIQDSEFARNGRGDGYTHGAYIGQVASLEVTGSYFHDTSVGSHLKSRAASNLIENNRFVDGTNGTASYNIDLPNGGVSVIRGNLIDQAATTSNRSMIHYGGEISNPVGSLLVEDNVFTNARAISTGVLNQTTLPVTIRDNALTNITYLAEGGATVQQGNYTRFAGAAGNQTITGGSGLDQADYSAATGAVTADLAAGTATDGFGGQDRLTAIDYVRGGRFADSLAGSAGVNRLEGGDGNDTLAGGLGNDSLDGGAGSDVARFSGNFAQYQLGGTTQAFTITGADGTDTVTDVETLVFADRIVAVSSLLGAPTVPPPPPPPPPVVVPPIGTLLGTAASDTLKGTDAADTLDGAAGADRMEGGKGDDTYIVDNAADFLADLTTADGGTDTAKASITWSIARQGYGIENLVLTGTANIDGTGNEKANHLWGNAGNNLLDGSSGADTMEGGAGDDTYVVENVGDLVVEAASSGTDTIRTSVDYTLPENVENLVQTGAIWISGTGNALANQITGNVQANKLYGLSGNDTLNGGANSDTLDGGDGTDTAVFSGSYAAYKVTGTVAQATIVGTDGTDRLIAIEQLQFADRVISLADALAGGSGTTTPPPVSPPPPPPPVSPPPPPPPPSTGTILGTAAADTLKGTDGNDLLDGAAGADRMEGGKGDDTYLVDHAGDFLADLTTADGGIDTAKSSISWSIARQGYGIENLALTGAADIDGTGNYMANHLWGNAGNNVLDGSSLADTMEGGAGDDTYIVETVGDTVIEQAGEGIDLVRSSVDFTLGANVENLVLTGSIWISGTGNALDNQITGNAQANKIDGGAGNDTLIGGGNKDSLTGGAGDDTFRFRTTADAGAVIKDLGQGDDHIDLVPLLQSLGVTGDVLTQGIVKLAASGANTLISIDADGAGAGAAITLATVEAVGVSTVRDHLLV